MSDKALRAARAALGIAGGASAQLSQITSAWKTWIPTITWTTATPVTVTAITGYATIGKTIIFSIRIRATDGNGATGLLVSLPVVPKNNGLNPMVSNIVLIGSSGNTRYITVRDNGTNNDISALYFGTATSGSALDVMLTGRYEIG